ncbi:hypothetical protein [Bacillus phage KonjoTrouble]|uniref:Uncharacterized protein n=3 Tax=Claudivirus TaxID=2842609 RepID=A0A514AAJ1_9CAUD|nr:hypothetical protein H3013_gp06 [Bacillus phage KonjoTrouble]YP_010114375.1 hypothetical protein KNV72_gp06 [Bacillus phage Thornton]ASU04129.1 hypothetical protein [Bacillus phage KonjoTrouble]QDH50288.1 hypothetical protein VIOLETTEMAD_7 [Bacillus phage VioletteMad]QQM14997.1 hypothetical protein THORNTON_6 [Bacillus phage Thornton]
MIEYCDGIVKLYNVETPNNKKGSWVNEEDFLRVVEELNNTKSRLERVVESKDITINQLRRAIEEKDVEIEKLKGLYKTDVNYYIDENKRLFKELKEMTKHKDKTFMKVLELETELFSIKGEETWTLKYIYDVDGVVKEYEQNGMFKEDAEELIGMDSDNWNHWSLTKEERPDKDKVIEGLLIRCETDEELIKELESRNENLANELYKLKNDQRLKIKPCDRRA